MTKEILLTQGKIALVDDEDYEWLSRYRWCAHKDKNTYYATRNFWRKGKWIYLKMHREILGLETGDGKITDHRDRNGLNNQRYNLRTVSRSLNAHNRKIDKRNTCGYRGVRWNKQCKKWISRIRVDGVLIYCGIYSSLIDAAKAYDAEATKHRGGDAVLNFPRR